MPTEPVVPVQSDHLRPARVHVLPGLGAVVLLALVATGLGHLAPVVGAPVFAIVGGIVIAVLRPPSASLRPGLGFAGSSVLQGSVVVLGTGLSFGQVLHTGASSLPVLAGTLVVALGGAAVLGRWLAIDRDLRTLVGMGTAICGASAIAATDAVIAASEADVSYAIATIFICNVVAVLTFPVLGHLLHLSPHVFGTWAGTAVNDLSSVVAAATAFGHGATTPAVVVKLTRTLAIVPLTLAIAAWRDRSTAPGVRPATTGPRPRGRQLRRIVPAFIGWFLLAVSLDTLGLVPRSWHGHLSALATFMITMALGAIGLSTRVRDLRRSGIRPLALGALLWLLVGSTSLGLQAVSGSLH